MKKKGASFSSSLLKYIGRLLMIGGGGVLGLITVLYLIPDIPSSSSPDLNRVVFSVEKGISYSTDRLQRNSFSKPYIQNAEPFSKEGMPKISLILLKPELVSQNIKNLPKEVSFAFAPYTPDIQYQISQARSQKREVLLMVPLEPIESSQEEEGPYTLLTNTSKEKNLKKLRKILSKTDASVGVIGFMGTRFLTSPKDLYPILEFLKKKEYLFIEETTPLSRTKDLEHHIKGPFLQSDEIVGKEEEDDEGIKNSFSVLEEKAKKNGSALGIIYLKEERLPLLQEWILSLENKGLVLAPVTALLKENV